MSTGSDGHPGLLARAQKISLAFDLSTDHVRRITNHLVGQMKDGLAYDRGCQLPSYVRSMPTGKEKGQYLAIDLGGSNCRICLVDLHGDSTFTAVSSKYRVPTNVMVNASYKPLFTFIAGKLADFLRDRPELSFIRNEKSAEGPYRLGFTFSFTCEQTSLARATLIHWDKGWDIPEALGKDPCAMLQESIDSLKLPVLVSVLANDSVGTLLTRSYNSGPKVSTLGAVIFGTGTNAAYVEKLSNIRKLSLDAQTDDIMAINTEWGCFDDAMEVLPRSPYDDELDAKSTDPGSQMLEKRVSGMYLGELLRLAILSLLDAGTFQMKVDEKSRLFKRESIDSSFLSGLASDSRCDAVDSAELIRDRLSATNISSEDVQAIRLISAAIARRAARLAGASLAAMIIQSGVLVTSRRPSLELDKIKIGRNEPEELSPVPATGSFRHFLSSFGLLVRRVLKFMGMGFLMHPPTTNPPQIFPADTDKTNIEEEDIIDIGADGSLIEHYPTFEADMRAAMREVPEIGENEARVRIGLVKDGSAVGAALMAQAAMQQQHHQRCA